MRWVIPKKEHGRMGEGEKGGENFKIGYSA
jgi:hypothetical protein